MPQTKGKKKRLLSNKFRVSLLNDTTHEKLFGFRAKGTYMIIALLLSIFILVVAVTVLIAFTPIRELIPGYPSAESRRNLIANEMKIDSLQNEINTWRLQLINIQRIATGYEPLERDSLLKVPANVSGKVKSRESLVRDDSLLRAYVVQEERFKLSNDSRRVAQLEGAHLFPPVKGVVQEPFNKFENHNYIKVSTESNSVVSSPLDGTVVSASYNDAEEYVVVIQHKYDLISLFRHNGGLLCKTGDVVKAGTPVAVAGDKLNPERSTYIFIEMWRKGEPVDPTLYITF